MQTVAQRGHGRNRQTDHSGSQSGPAEASPFAANSQWLIQKGVKAMNRKSHISRMRHASFGATALLFALVLNVFVFGWTPNAEAQTPSTVDTMRIVSQTVSLNDTFDLDIYFRNVDTLGGWTIRLVFDSTLIQPLLDTVGANRQFSDFQMLRGTAELSDVFGGSSTDTVATMTYIDFNQNPSTLFFPGAGVTVRTKWRVLPTATAQTTVINFRQDPAFPSSHNTFSDYRAIIFKRPTLVSGAITITGGPPPPGGVAPVVQQPASPVSVNQGDLLTFNVTATDADGDSLTLLAFNLPSGAQFTPANPARGAALVTGTFRWTPSFSQSGSFVVSFQATDSTGRLSTPRNVTIDVGVVPRDLLFTTSTPELEPQGGVPGAVGVVIPVNFVQVQTSYGVQFDFVYDPASFTPTAVQASTRLDGFSLYDDVGQTPGRLRVVAFSLNADAVGAGTSSVLFNIIGNIPASAVPGAYDVTFENAFESINPDPNVASIDLATENGFVFVDFLGDVNLDGRIDVADVVNVVGYILGDFTLTFRQFVAADVVTDNMVDVFDLVEIINIIFGNPSANNVPSGALAVLSLSYDPYDGPNGAYVLDADLPDDVAGAQFDIKYNKELISLGAPERLGSAAGVNLYYRSYGSGRVAAVLLRNPFQENSKIPAGNGALLRIPVTALAAGSTPSARIDAAKLSDPNANKIEVSGISPVPRSFALEQNYPNPFNGSTVITFSLDDQAAARIDTRLDVFNVLGQKIKTLQSGELPAQGSFSFTWDGTDNEGNGVASGVYFYRLTMGDKNESRKMVLLK